MTDPNQGRAFEPDKGPTNPYLDLLRNQGAGAPASGNPYLDLLKQQDALKAGSTAANSAGMAPDTEAKLQALAKQYGLPMSAVRLDPAPVEQRALYDQAAGAATQSPALAKALANPNFAAVARDDIGTLGQIGQTVQRLAKGAGVGLTFDISSAAYGVLELGSRFAADAIQPLVGRLIPENPLRRMAAGFSDLRKMQQAQADAIVGDLSKASTLERGITSGFRSFGTMLPGTAATVITGNPAFALGSAGLVTGSTSATKALDRGLSPTRAALYGAADAAAEIATERLPVTRLLKDLKAGAPFLKVLGRQIVTQVPTEMAATAWQGFNEWAMLNPDKPITEWLDQQPQAQAETVIATITTSILTAGMGSGLQAAGRRMQRTSEEAERAQANAQALDVLSRLAGESKLRNRAPDQFEALLREATRDGLPSELFIDSKMLAQSPKLREITEALPSVAQQLDAAMQTGGDVRIPIEEFTTRLADGPLAQELIPHVRLDPESMSQDQAQVFSREQGGEMEAALQAVQSESAQALSAMAARDAIEQDIMARLQEAGRFSPSVNRAYAQLPAAFFETMGKRLGVPALDLYQAFAPTITVQGVTGPMLNQNNQGGFVPGDLTPDGKPIIALFKSANLSTFLHESAHWFLEAYGAMANDAPVLQADMQTLLSWLGVPDLAAWQAMDLEARREAHERFAQGFEDYLAQGNAPSVEVRSLFARFADWLRSVYRGVRQLNVDMPDEVRAVLDRMLATDDQIEALQRTRALSPLFTDRAQAEAFGLPWENYLAAHNAASAEAIEALQARSVRDMAWTSRLREDTAKRLNKEAKALRDEVRLEVEAEMQREPVYQAMRWLKRGEMTGIDGETIKATAGHRLAIDRVQALYPPGGLDSVAWENLGYGAFGMLGKEGLDPDLVAEMFGFTSGDQMIRSLLSAPPIEQTIEAQTDLVMLQRYGDLSSEQAIGRAADQAIANDVRTRFLATELAALQNALNAGGARALVKAARETAQAMVDRTPLASLKPAQYAVAQTRAAKAAEQAMREGDTMGAIRFKRQQLINHVAMRLAYEAQDQARKTVQLFRDIASANVEEVRKTRNIDLANAARAMLAEHGLGMRGKDPREYMRAVQAYDPELFAAIEPLLEDVQANAKPIEQMSVAELQTLRDQVESLWYLARREKQAEIDGQMIDRNQIAQELTERLDELGLPERVPGEGQAVTEGEKRVRYLLGVRAALRRVESWVDQIDGGVVTGAFRKFVFQPISEAADAYRADAARYMKAYRDLLKAIEPTLVPGRIDARELGYSFGHSKGGNGMAELLHAILHTGNASNKRKLLLGRGWATELPDGQLDTARWDAFIDRMIREGRLTQAHFEFAQGVWDLLEQTKPLAQRTHREVFGRYFEEVTAEPFTNALGTFRGGYIPALADTFEVQDAALNAALDDVNRGNAYMFPSTNRGFTKSRVEYNRPLALDLRLLPQHLDKVLLFAHLEPKVRDVMRTLRHRGVQSSLTRFDATAYTDMLLPWLNRAAKQTVETPATGWGGKLADQFFRNMRNRAGMAAMFANITNTLQQVTGFSLAALKIKPRYLLAATTRYLRNPAQMTQDIAEASPFMAQRQSDEVAAMRQEINELLLNPSQYDQIKAWSAQHAYFLQQALQNVMDSIVWSAAYDQAIEAGGSEQDAIRLGNAAVRATQGSQQPEDISRFESGPAFVRMFTQFASYFNMQANLLGTEWAKVVQAMGARQSVGPLLYIFVLGFLAPAWAAEAIVIAMRGGLDDEDEDGYLDEFLAVLFGAPARTLAAMVPVAGQASVVAFNSFNNKPYDDRMSTAPAISMLESAARAPQSVYNALADNGKASRAIRDTLTLVSLATGIPVAALGRPLGYVADMAQGGVEPSGPLDAARGIISGRLSPGTQ